MIDAPYRHESDTSRSAAEAVNPRVKSDEEAVFQFIKSRGEQGATIDEISVWMSEESGVAIPPGTASARVSGLLDNRRISKTPMRRRTRAGRDAVVHIAGTWSESITSDQTLERNGITHRRGEALEAVAKFKSGQAAFGHGHVVSRADGRREGCGGPRVCRTCSQASNYLKFLEQKVEAADVT